MKVSLVKAKLWTKWMLFAVVLTYVISGLGIKYFRLIESITFNLLTKTLSFKIHSVLLIPFLILLFLHIYLTRKNK